MHTLTDTLCICSLVLLTNPASREEMAVQWLISLPWHSGNSSELWSNIHSTNDNSDTTLLSSVVETEQFDDPPAEQTSATTLLPFPDSWIQFFCKDNIQPSPAVKPDDFPSKQVTSFNGWCFSSREQEGPCLGKSKSVVWCNIHVRQLPKGTQRLHLRKQIMCVKCVAPNLPMLVEHKNVQLYKCLQSSICTRLLSSVISVVGLAARSEHVLDSTSPTAL